MKRLALLVVVFCLGIGLSAQAQTPVPNLLPNVGGTGQIVWGHNTGTPDNGASFAGQLTGVFAAKNNLPGVAGSLDLVGHASTTHHQDPTSSSGGFLGNTTGTSQVLTGKDGTGQVGLEGGLDALSTSQTGQCTTGNCAGSTAGGSTGVGYVADVSGGTAKLTATQSLTGRTGAITVPGSSTATSFVSAVSCLTLVKTPSTTVPCTGSSCGDHGHHQ